MYRVLLGGTLAEVFVRGNEDAEGTDGGGEAGAEDVFEDDGGRGV